MKLAWTIALVALAGGCKAHFVDERPASQRTLDEADAGAVDLYGVDLPVGVLARGSFAGRDGHAGMGSVELSRDADGSLRLAFGPDFSCTDVPGPEVVLSARSELGVVIKPDSDLDLGALVAPAGAQSYAVADAAGHPWVFVFCEPYGIEVARAELVGTLP